MIIKIKIKKEIFFFLYDLIMYIIIINSAQNLLKNKTNITKKKEKNK